MPYPRPRVETNNRGPVAGGKVSAVMALSQRRWLQGVLKLIRDDARKFAPQDLGAFRRSIIYRTYQRGAEVSGEVFSTDKPAAKVAVIEYGREAGKPPPPKGALLGWMARHGFPPEAEDNIRWKISHEGIPAKEPFRRAFVKRRGLLAAEARHLESALVRDLNG